MSKELCNFGEAKTWNLTTYTAIISILSRFNFDIVHVNALVLFQPVNG